MYKQTYFQNGHDTIVLLTVVHYHSEICINFSKNFFVIKSLKKLKKKQNNYNIDPDFCEKMVNSESTLTPV